MEPADIFAMDIDLHQLGSSCSGYPFARFQQRGAVTSGSPAGNDVQVVEGGDSAVIPDVGSQGQQRDIYRGIIREKSDSRHPGPGVKQAFVRASQDLVSGRPTPYRKRRAGVPRCKRRPMSPPWVSESGSHPLSQCSILNDLSSRPCATDGAGNGFGDFCLARLRQSVSDPANPREPETRGSGPGAVGSADRRCKTNGDLNLVSVPPPEFFVSSSTGSLRRRGASRLFILRRPEVPREIVFCGHEFVVVSWPLSGIPAFGGGVSGGPFGRCRGRRWRDRGVAHRQGGC